MNIPSAKPQPIFVVEDSPTQATRVQYLLEKAGYEVVHCRNGAEALHQLESCHPSLIICDVVMPVMDGHEFCRSMKSDERLRQIPIILHTTLSEPADIFKGLECGADHYVIKPFDEELMLQRIRTVLAEDGFNGPPPLQTQPDLGITYGGKKYFINAERIQILDLLLATFEDIARKNKELEQINQQLKTALETNKILRGLIPICAYCKKIRDDKGFWQQVECYVQEHTEAAFSHGICPDCACRFFPDHFKK